MKEILSMSHEQIAKKLALMAGKYSPATMTELGKPLTGSPHYINSRDFAAFFLDIESAFGIEINKIFDEDVDGSVNSIASAIELHL
jgi:hypothetical protein